MGYIYSYGSDPETLRKARRARNSSWSRPARFRVSKSDRRRRLQEGGREPADATRLAADLQTPASSTGTTPPTLTLPGRTADAGPARYALIRFTSVTACAGKCARSAPAPPRRPGGRWRHSRRCSRCRKGTARPRRGQGGHREARGGIAGGGRCGQGHRERGRIRRHRPAQNVW